MQFRANRRVAPDLFYKKAESRRTQGYDVKVKYLEDNTVAFGEFIPGNFSIVGIQIDFEGRSKQYIYNYFVPTTMFTVTSWFSYLLPPTSYPARTSLLVTIFLCQIGIFTSAIKETPSSDNGILRSSLQILNSPILLQEWIHLRSGASGTSSAPLALSLAMFLSWSAWKLERWKQIVTMSNRSRKTEMINKGMLSSRLAALQQLWEVLSCLL